MIIILVGMIATVWFMALKPHYENKVVPCYDSRGNEIQGLICFEDKPSQSFDIIFAAVITIILVAFATKILLERDGDYV